MFQIPEVIYNDIEDILNHIEFRYLEYNMYFDEEDIERYWKAKRVLNWWNKTEEEKKVVYNEKDIV